MLTSPFLSPISKLFVLGTCGALGTSDLLACFTAGCALNWDGQFLAETQRRHDDFNSCIDVLLNLAGFAYIGMTVPWASFAPGGAGPDTGITGPRLLALGLLVLVFRRIPALLACYRLMPAVVPGWRDAVFMGYFGPIGVGAIYYLEHTRILLLRLPHRTPVEERLLQTIGPGMGCLSFSLFVVNSPIPPPLGGSYPNSFAFTPDGIARDNQKTNPRLTSRFSLLQSCTSSPFSPS